MCARARALSLCVAAFPFPSHFLIQNRQLLVAQDYKADFANLNVAKSVHMEVIPGALVLCCCVALPLTLYVPVPL